ncbi:MAG: hypothetical protein ACOY3X_07780 [Pseudomonadota bacterium]
MNNPYQPPGSDPSVPDNTPGPLWKAVLFGVLVDLGGTLLSAMALLFVTAVIMAMNGASEAEITRYSQTLDPWSGLGLLMTMAGLVMSVLGGYVCARTARTRIYKASAIAGAVTWMLATMLSAGVETGPLDHLMSAVSFAALLAGAAIYAQQQRARQPGMKA